jgi:SAM-dependent methyltransferase
LLRLKPERVGNLLVGNPMQMNRDKQGSLKKLEVGRYVAMGLGGFVVAATAAIVPFMLVPWLPRRIFGALPWLPTSERRVKRALDALPSAFTQPGRRFVDLGSGDGVAVIAAAQRGMAARGVELNPTLVLVSKLRAWRRGAKAEFVLGNMFSFPLHDDDVVMVFGVVPLMARIGEKIERELQGPVYVLSNKFALPADPWDKWLEQTVDGVRIYRKPGSTETVTPHQLK